MIQVGITGGIGSGKSTVARIFEAMGYAVYYADTGAKRLMVEDEDLIEGVKKLLGKEAYSEDGLLNRAFVGSQVFSDEKKLEALNGLVHPAVGRDYQRWVRSMVESEQYDKAFVMKEAAILFESGSYRDTDFVISVYAPKAIRIARVVARDGTTEASVLDRMSKQWPERKKIDRSDYVIYNDGVHMLIPQVRELIGQIVDFSTHRSPFSKSKRNI